MTLPRLLRNLLNNKQNKAVQFLITSIRMKRRLRKSYGILEEAFQQHFQGLMSIRETNYSL